MVISCLKPFRDALGAFSLLVLVISVEGTCTARILDDALIIFVQLFGHVSV
jgi:hypothetical protein